MIVSSSGDKAIAFTPGEVDMLFPGPFSRARAAGIQIARRVLWSHS